MQGTTLGRIPNPGALKLACRTLFLLIALAEHIRSFHGVEKCNA